MTDVARVGLASYDQSDPFTYNNRRPIMSRMSRALERIKQDLEGLVPAEVVERICNDLNHKYRKRKLDPLTTVHLFAQQVLNYNASLAHLRRLSGMDFDASAFCDARKRLPLEVLRRLLRHVAEAARRQTDPRGLWLGHRTWLIDGSSCSMPDTPSLQKEFGQPSEQKEGCGFPVAHLLAMFDAYSGMLAEVVASPLNTHDLSKVWSLHPLMAAGDVVAADRAFCSYAHLATLSVRGVYPVFRINQAMIVKFRSRPEPRQVLKPTKGQPRSRFIKRR